MGVWSTYLKLCQQLVQSGVYLGMADLPLHTEKTLIPSWLLWYLCMCVHVNVYVYVCACGGGCSPISRVLVRSLLRLDVCRSNFSPLPPNVKRMVLNVHENFQFYNVSAFVWVLLCVYVFVCVERFTISVYAFIFLVLCICMYLPLKSYPSQFLILVWKFVAHY